MAGDAAAAAVSGLSLGVQTDGKMASLLDTMLYETALEDEDNPEHSAIMVIII